LVFAKLRLERFVKANCLRGDDMHERSALDTGKNRGVDLLGELFLAHDNAAARSAQTFMRRGGDKLCVWNRTEMLSTGHQTSDVRHIDKQNCANRIGDLAQPRKIDDARI